MAKTENQKLKTLYVAKYFLDHSDENHPAVTKDIVDYLKDEYGIKTERRSIYRDIAVLRDDFGMDIVGGQGGRFRLMSRQFEFDDLRLLAECVYAAKFISVTKSKELVKTICRFASVHQAADLQKDVFLCDRVKSMQKGTLNIISRINMAMAKKLDGKPHTPQKISFKYLKYTINDVEHPTERRQGKLYKVSPYRLLLNDGNYYLLAFDDWTKEMRTYRIDRMKEVELVNEPREGQEVFAEIDIETYTTRVFSMFGGEKQHVGIRFEDDLLDTVIDRFGTGRGVFYRPEGEKHFVVTTEVEISDQFFGWVCGFGRKAKIVSPASVVEQFKVYIEKINDMYD